MSIAKIDRNKNIIKLRDKKRLTFSKIGEQYNIGKQTVYDIYRREKARKELSTYTA